MLPIDIDSEFQPNRNMHMVCHESWGFSTITVVNFKKTLKKIQEIEIYGFC